MNQRDISAIVEYFPPGLGGDQRIFRIVKRMSQKIGGTFISVPRSYASFVRKIDRRHPVDEELRCENMTGHRIGMPQIRAMRELAG